MPARTYPITKIDTDQFTDLMMMQLKVCLERYLYLKHEYPAFRERPYSDNDDFVIEYYDFYALGASRKDFSNRRVVRTYFEMLKEGRDIDPTFLVEEFRQRLLPEIVIGDHISFCSKLCHTVCDIVPIIDSRVKEYLSKVYCVEQTFQGVHDWYYTQDPEIREDQDQLLHWFRTNPQLQPYQEVGDIKAIDSIIFIWHKYH